MSARANFCQLALAQLGATVLWGSRGPEVFDCSGLVAWCLRAVGGPDWRATHKAQTLFDACRELEAGEKPQPGDLAFYGANPASVVHVAIWLAGDKWLSADGATSRVTDLAAAKANKLARVTLHERPFRRDFLEVRRFLALDVPDRICL